MTRIAANSCHLALVQVDAAELISDSVIISFEEVAFFCATFLFLYSIADKAEIND